jgi:hypothetical protein
MALGRRNWTFAGSDAGGERAAAFYSLIETAKLHGRKRPFSDAAVLVDRFAQAARR